MPIATIPTRSSRIESTSSPFASWSLKSRSIEPSESAPFDSFTLYSETLTIDVMSVTIEHTSADMYACVMSVLKASADGTATFETIYQKAEELHCDVVTAALNSMKRKKVISYDKEMGLLYPVDKDAVITLLKPDFDCFA